MLKNRNKLIMIIPIIFIIGITCFNSDAMAHPAVTMDLHYDEDTTTLSVYITHGVSDPTYHFTETIVVRVNGTIEATGNYSSQDSNTIDHYLFNVSAHEHDIINVTATCSLGGVYSKVLIIGHYHHEDKGSFADAAPHVILGTVITVGIFAIPYAFNRDHPDILERKLERKKKKLAKKKRKKMKGEK